MVIHYKEGAKDDLLNGRIGNDKLIGGGGNDQLIGGDGIDTAIFGSGNNKIDLAITERQGTREGRDILTGIENVKGGDGNDLIKGDSVNNYLYGEAGNDRLYGRDGDDRLYGRDGDDVLFGEVGNDIIFGGAGNNRLTGGAGRDKFCISFGDGRDVITDYTSGEDKIKLLSGIPEEFLNIRQVGEDVKIKYFGDLMAIVQDSLIADLTFI